MHRKNTILMLLGAVPLPPPIPLLAFEDIRDAVIRVLGLILLLVLSGIVGYLVYAIVEFLVGPKRGIAALIGLVGVLLFWLAMYFLVSWIDANVPALKIVTWAIKEALNSAADLIGAPHPF
ncbi:hypothetical protein [Infirmifilum sp. SLHALR2]|nr:MAG: hypothetical protein B7L53_09760 [Thermofilum sp. NZ13]